MSYLGAVNGLSAAVSSILALSAKKYWSPLNLFALGEKGAWFDPSDISTLFQDSAGTTPVTAVEQPVGLMKDKSGNLKDALQATAGNRPTYRARYNLLTFSEQFTNAAWTPGATTITDNNQVSPIDGTTTAANVVPTVANSSHFFQTAATFTGTFTTEIYVKANGYTNFSICNSAQTIFVDFNLSNQTAAVGGSATASITSLPNGWLKLYATLPAVSASAIFYFVNGRGTYTGDGTSGVFVAGADMRNGTSQTFPYQKITTATSYNAVGFLPYLAFNGTSSAMATAAIDLSAIKQLSVFSGVTELNGNVGAIVSSNPPVTTAGSFLQWFNASAALEWYAEGSTTAVRLAETTPIAWPRTAVLTNTADLTASGSAGAGLTSRYNGATLATTPTGIPPGTDTFANAALGIGIYNAANWINGNLYGLIVRGASSTAAEIASTEAWMNSRTGAY